MVTPFVPSPESDRVSRSNPRDCLILRECSAGDSIGCYGRCSPETGKVACKRSSVHRCCWFVELLPWSSEFRHCSSRNHRRSLQPRSKPSSLHKRRREFVVFLYCRQNFYYCWSRGKTRRKMKREVQNKRNLILGRKLDLVLLN
nr:hypothetical protein DM860_003161 [Ipomoea batatas]